MELTHEKWQVHVAMYEADDQPDSLLRVPRSASDVCFDQVRQDVA